MLPSCPVGPSGGVAVIGGAGVGAAEQTIALDGTSSGRVFDGIGAVSGGGGNSRLLIDYPEPERSEILDYLFKPGYGAALQILKVEIGADTQSTDGAEPSHQHSANDLNCGRGYEWWLMQQAKARNPNIKFYGLTWGVPSWVSEGKLGNFWTQSNIDYHLAWLDCAKMNGLAIDYLGGWNERGYDKSWYQTLNAALASHGYATKLVADDTSGNDFKICDDMVSDASFNGAIAVVGVHYPCGYQSPQSSCPSTSNALSLGKPLWASENGSQDYNAGASAMARAHNRDYIDGKMTGSLNWALVSSMVPNLSWEGSGLLVASEPWSGAYNVGEQLWVTAHTTQFAQPGWRYLDSASGYLKGDRSNGSYVTLRSSNGDYSVVLETADAQQAQTVAFQVSGGLSTSDLHLWASKLGSPDSTAHFVHAADLTGTGGSYWITLEPKYIYTITTTSGQCKSAATSPTSQPSQPLPYAETFEGFAVGTEARLISDMEGSFEVVKCGGGRAGQCLRQMAPNRPVSWGQSGTPFTLVGTNDWADYTVSADVLLESPGSVELLGRFGGFDYENDGRVNAYYASFSDSGAWSIYANSRSDGMHKILASGTAAGLGAGAWHTISLRIHGSALTTTLDGATLGTTNDSSFVSGLVGLSVGSASSSWLSAQFDNLRVTTQ